MAHHRLVGANTWNDEIELDDSEQWLPLILRLGGLRSLRPAERLRRAFSGWCSVLDRSKMLTISAASRLQTLVRRGKLKAFHGWVDLVDTSAVNRAAANRVARRHARLQLALVLLAWRHLVSWHARWRVIGPVITKRWTAARLRDVTYCWLTAVRHLQTLQLARDAADALQRRRNAGLLTDYLLEWTQCASLMSMRTRIVDTARLRCVVEARRSMFWAWRDLRVLSACRAKAASIVRRRQDIALKWDAYHRWSDWSYTSWQHRRCSLRAFDRMRISTAAVNHTVTVWKRLSAAQMLETVSDEMKHLGGHLREHMAMALWRGIARSITKLMRSILREWSYLRRNNVRLQEIAARAARRTQARLCSAMLEAWNALLDHKSFLGLVYTRIHRRSISTLSHTCVVLWREFVLRAYRFRNRLRRLRRRVLLHSYTRIVRQWQVPCPFPLHPRPHHSLQSQPRVCVTNLCVCAWGARQRRALASCRCHSQATNFLLCGSRDL